MVKSKKGGKPTCVEITSSVATTAPGLSFSSLSSFAAAATTTTDAAVPAAKSQKRKKSSPTARGAFLYVGLVYSVVAVLLESLEGLETLGISTTRLLSLELVLVGGAGVGAALVVVF